MARHLTAVLLLVMAAHGNVQDPAFRIRIDVTALAPREERWLSVRSKHFHVVGSADERKLRRVAADLELFREQFALSFPRARAVSSVPTTVVVFRDGDSYRPFRRLYDGRSEDVDAYFQPGADTHYLVLGADAPTRAVYRQYVRTLLPDSFGPVPEWFRTGLAEYFTTFKVNWIGENRWIEVGGRDKQFTSLLRNESLIPLSTLFQARLEPADGREDPKTTLEAESWAFVHYVILDRRAVEPALNLVQSIGEGEQADEAFRLAFNMDVEQFEGVSTDNAETDTGFRRYVREGRVGLFNPGATLGGLGESPKPPRTPGGWKVALAGFSLSDLRQMRVLFYGASTEIGSGTSLVSVPVNRDVIWEEVSKLPVRALSEAETQFQRGNLMLHIDRLDEAEAFLDFALRIDPELADAEAALGLLRVRRDQFGPAREALGRALVLKPDHALAHYYTAQAIRREAEAQGGRPAPEQLESMRTALKKVIDTAPSFVEAYQMLAEGNVLLGSDLEEALDLTREALRRAPGREGLVLTLARVLAANRDGAEAARVLDKVSSSTTADTFLRAAAEELRVAVREVPENPGAFQEFFAAAPDPAQETVEVRAPVETIPEGVLVPINPDGTTALKGEVLSGKLTLLDCSSGLTLSVETEGRTAKLHTATPEKLEFLRHTTAVGTAISCGPVGRLSVTITYRPDTSTAGAIGEPLRVEFVED